MREGSGREGFIQFLPPEFAAQLQRTGGFPDLAKTSPEGLLAYGGDLSGERLLSAYAQGIFPWYEVPPILWYSPDPRAWLLLGDLRVNRSLAKTLRRGRYEVRFDTDFRRVIEACASVPRPGQSGTWIGPDMIEAYCELHRLGFAHSVESWFEDQLVGGIYGISLGGAFFGESMFSLRPDASKVAFVSLVRRIESWGFHFLDCQQYTEHTASLGAVVVSRDEFMLGLSRALEKPTRCGVWTQGENWRSVNLGN